MKNILKDSTNSYGEISWLNHWIIAAIVGSLIFSGLLFASITKSEASRTIILLHTSIGTIAIPFILFRIFWRIKNGFPRTMSDENKIFVYIVRIMQSLILLSLFLLIISGPLTVLSQARDINIFGLFSISSPFSQKNELIHNIAETIHTTTANPILISLIILHILGAVKRIFINRKPTFTK